VQISITGWTRQTVTPARSVRPASSSTARSSSPRKRRLRRRERTPTGPSPSDQTATSSCVLRRPIGLGDLLGKRFRDRTPRDPRRLRALAAIWVRAEWVRELVIAAADRRPAADWRILRDLASEAGARLTLVVERRASSDHLAELGDDVRELTLSELVEKLPVAMPADEWGLFDESGTPDDRPGYPPVPDVDRGSLLRSIGSGRRC
jgi:hypothetical protein